MRIKLTDEKGHLQAGWALFLFTFALLIIMSLVYASTDRNRDQLKAKLQAAYQKSLYDTIYGINVIENDLSKVTVMQNKNNAAALFSNISVGAEKIQVNLTQLPLNHASVEKTTKFVNTLGDYARYLSGKLYKGEDLSEEEKSNIKSLRETASSLNGELQEVILLLNDHQLDLTQMNPEWNQGDASAEMSEYWSEIENTSIEYPALIYDGPFSQAENKNRPKEDREEVSVEDALNFAAKFLNLDSSAFTQTNDTQSGGYACYNFDVNGNGIQGSISVAKGGGLIDWYINNQENADGELSVEEAGKKAQEYIKPLELGDMKVVWAAEYGNTIVLNMTPVINDTIIYPDMIKIKLAKDTGALMGFDGREYIINHTNRDIKAPAHDKSEAEKKVFSELEIQNTQLCLAPIGNQEILCWEFFGTYNNQRFIVYIDANTLEEVNVMRIISTDSGDLVV